MLLLLLLPTSSIAKDIHIISTIKPIESLIFNVIDKHDSVTSMIDKNYSPHDFALRPSHIRKLYQSDVIIIINPEFETFMQTSFKLIPKTSKIILLSDTPHLTLYNNTKSSSHHHSKTDYHIWLSVNNSIAIINHLAKQLSILNPEKQDIYQKNAQRTVKKLLELDTDIKNKLNSVQDKPFMVFHNGLQYYIKSYGLNFIGTITDNPVAYTSIKKIHNAQQKLIANKVVCVFQEPQFSDKKIQAVIQNTNTKVGTIDYLANNINSGKNHYFQMMKSLSENMIQCLNNN